MNRQNLRQRRSSILKTNQADEVTETTMTNTLRRRVSFNKHQYVKEFDHLNDISKSPVREPVHESLSSGEPSKRCEASSVMSLTFATHEDNSGSQTVYKSLTMDETCALEPTLTFADQNRIVSPIAKSTPPVIPDKSEDSQDMQICTEMTFDIGKISDSHPTLCTSIAMDITCDDGTSKSDSTGNFLNEIHQKDQSSSSKKARFERQNVKNSPIGQEFANKFHQVEMHSSVNYSNSTQEIGLEQRRSYPSPVRMNQTESTIGKQVLEYSDLVQNSTNMSSIDMSVFKENEGEQQVQEMLGAIRKKLRRSVEFSRKNLANSPLRSPSCRWSFLYSSNATRLDKLEMSLREPSGNKPVETVEETASILVEKTNDSDLLQGSDYIMKEEEMQKSAQQRCRQHTVLQESIEESENSRQESLITQRRSNIVEREQDPIPNQMSTINELDKDEQETNETISDFKENREIEQKTTANESESNSSVENVEQSTKKMAMSDTEVEFVEKKSEESTDEMRQLKLLAAKSRVTQLEEILRKSTVELEILKREKAEMTQKRKLVADRMNDLYSQYMMI